MCSQRHSRAPGQQHLQQDTGHMRPYRRSPFRRQRHNRALGQQHLQQDTGHNRPHRRAPLLQDLTGPISCVQAHRRQPRVRKTSSAMGKGPGEGASPLAGCFSLCHSRGETQTAGRGREPPLAAAPARRSAISPGRWRRGGCVGTAATRSHCMIHESYFC